MLRGREYCCETRMKEEKRYEERCRFNYYF